MKKLLIALITILSASAFAVDANKTTGTAAVDDTFLKKETVKDATTKTGTEDENMLNSSTGQADRHGWPVDGKRQNQEEPQKQEYREDGFEDIESDPYVDNGNGTTTNRKSNNKDPQE